MPVTQNAASNINAGVLQLIHMEMADNGTAVASWVYIWINGKIPWTEQDVLNFRSCSPKLTVARWDTVTFTAQESKTYLWTKRYVWIQNVSLDQRQKVKKWLKENCTLCIMLYDLCGLISIAGLVLCFCSFFSPSLSGFLDTLSPFATFHPYESCFVIPFLGLFFLTFLLWSLHHQAVLHLLIFFIPSA